MGLSVKCRPLALFKVTPLELVHIGNFCSVSEVVGKYKLHAQHIREALNVSDPAMNPIILKNKPYAVRDLSVAEKHEMYEAQGVM